MQYSQEVEQMVCVAKGPNHGPAPIPEEGQWITGQRNYRYFRSDARRRLVRSAAGRLQADAERKEGRHSGSPGGDARLLRHDPLRRHGEPRSCPARPSWRRSNTDLVCDAINTAMRELFLQIVYGRTQTAFSEDGLVIGAGLEDLGKGLRSQVGTMYGTKLNKGTRYLEMAEGYVLELGSGQGSSRSCGYQVRVAWAR